MDNPCKNCPNYDWRVNDWCNCEQLFEYHKQLVKEELEKEHNDEACDISKR